VALFGAAAAVAFIRLEVAGAAFMAVRAAA
jgi:hypothetical protein